MVGKRKREATVISRETEKTGPPKPADHHHDVFRRYFESRFLPLSLDLSQSTKEEEEAEEEEGDDDDDDDDEDEEESEWDGVSDGQEEEQQVEVIECKDSASVQQDDRNARKAFMV